MSGQKSETLVLEHAFRVSVERPKTAKRKGKRSKRPTPVSLRLTVEERAQLEREAGGRSLSAHIRDRLFSGNAAPRKTKGARSVKDHAALARVLSALGQSNLAEDFDNLAWAVRDGSIVFSLESEQALQQACGDIAAMRRDLLKALGLRVGE